MTKPFLFALGWFWVACSTPQSPPKTHTQPASSNEIVMSKDPKLSVQIASPATEYKASWDTAGKIAYPQIPLQLVLSNPGKGDWKCESVVLEVTAERSKKQEKKRFALRDCVLENQGSHTETVEAGEFLSSVAAHFMKGDVLTIRAMVAFQTTKGFSAITIFSSPIQLSIFIPEG